MDSLASRITGTEFPLVKKGYDPDAVDTFIESISKSVVGLEEELSVAKAKAAKLEDRLRSTSDADTVVQTAFLAAAEAKAKLLQEAEARGAEIIAAAEARAAEIAHEVTTEDGSPDAARAIERAPNEVCRQCVGRTPEGADVTGESAPTLLGRLRTAESGRGFSDCIRAVRNTP